MSTKIMAIDICLGISYEHVQLIHDAFQVTRAMLLIREDTPSTWHVWTLTGFCIGYMALKGSIIIAKQVP